VTKSIVIIAPPLATLQDVTGPWEVFCRAEAYAPGSYAVEIVAADAELEVRTKFGLPIMCARSIYDVRGAIDTVLIAGSDQGIAGAVDPRLLAWLRDVRVRRMASICTGAFYLARAGLLDGRRATTHWRFLRALAEAFPAITVDPEPIFVRDGEIYTSAGITAGIDLALALVEADHGHACSQAIARDLLVFVQRQADQPQVSTALAQRMADRDPIRTLQRWAPDILLALSTVDDMAAYVHMSPRNFARLFRRETGVTPGRYLRRLRAEAARRRVQELPDGSTAAVAAEVGFGSTKSLRRSLGGFARVRSRKT
jgi:transcriptional regulator GlxA family with amidase domain